MSEISIADIARIAGVSHTTVSRALHGSPLISPDTRERIQQLAREMGYTPNSIAQSLQTKRSNMIGLVITTIDDPFLGDVARGVEEVARSAGFGVLFSTTHNDPDLEMEAIEAFHRRRVDGILVASSRITSLYQDRLRAIHIPTVLINSQAESQAAQLHWVSVDDTLGAQLAVEHLLQLGHRAIGYLGTTCRPRSNLQRLQAYQKTLLNAHIAPQESFIVMVTGTEASYEGDIAAGYTSLPRLLEAGCTAVFCYNDMVAIGALMACQERNIVVPRDISLIGFDNIKIASYVTPSLTTIHQPKVEMGQCATKVILDLLQHRPGKNHLLQPSLISRSSTAQLMKNL